MQALRKGSVSIDAAFLLPFRKPKAKNLGVQGAEPLSYLRTAAAADSEKSMAKNSHLTLSDRIAIEVGLRERRCFASIAQELEKDPSTISKEVRNHVKLSQSSGYNPCSLRKKCGHHGDLCKHCEYSWGKECSQCSFRKCFKQDCPDLTVIPCPRLSKPPYVCNGCTERQGCKLERHLYDAKFAQTEYEAVRSESRQGFAITPSEAERIDSILSPLVKQGQSLHQICVNNADEIMLAERTIYNYVDAGIFSVGNIDLPRKVRYKVRKKRPSIRVDRNCHLGRTYEDFLEYTGANPDLPVVEIDSVEGKKSGKVLLTVFFRNSNLMLSFLRERNTARSVTDVFEWLYSTLGHELYCRMFPVILTDRGSEFTNPVAIECTEFGEIRSRVFYCDPQRSDQKGGCEVTHEFIRRILPKGSSFDHLQQSDINLMMSHINSYTRKKLGNQSAYRLFSFFYGESVLSSLGIHEIPANDINLTPRLLNK